ncbi:MAG: phage major capsid protein [Xanthomonadales bacterium]|nr:phage major capsid protein [Xanthomonadales bacterium]
MNKALRALLQRKAGAVAAARQLTDLAAAENRDLSAEEQTAIDGYLATAEGLNAAIASQQRLIEAERSVAGTALELPDDARIEAGAPNLLQDPQRGFAHFGAFLGAVRGAAIRPSAVDERLSLSAAAASTYANESSGADGGFLVPPQYSSEIMSVIDGTESLFNRVRQIPVAGNTFMLPVSEETAHGTTGVQSYWDGEADTITQTKPVFQNREIKLNRLTALVPVTEEALEDANALGAWVQMMAGERMAFKVSDAILNGNGVGMPLGILSAGCLVTVTKETSQAASTVLAANVLKMYSRMPAANRMRAVWVINQDVEPLLPQMSVAVKNVAGTENVGGFPVYVPPGGITGNQYGTLLGRPIVMTESAPALSSAGDILLADFNQYLAITKGAVKAEQSMHFWFDQNLRAFRFVLRVGGMPWLSAAMARKNGSNTLSHFVALGAR